MHITSIILLIYAVLYITFSIFTLQKIELNKKTFLSILLIVFSIFSVISIYDQECIINSSCSQWGWIRFGLILLFIIIPSIVVTGYGWIINKKDILVY